MQKTINPQEIPMEKYQSQKEFMEKNISPLTIWEFQNYIGAIQYLDKRGLDVTQTPASVKRGSIMVSDPLTGRRFSITINGYIRTYKIFPGWECYGAITYQLNPKVNLAPNFRWGNYQRVLFPKEYSYMATLLWKTIQRTRKNIK